MQEKMLMQEKMMNPLMFSGQYQMLNQQPMMYPYGQVPPALSFQYPLSYSQISQGYHPMPTPPQPQPNLQDQYRSEPPPNMATQQYIPSPKNINQAVSSKNNQS